jgi:hypothetical protein
MIFKYDTPCLVLCGILILLQIQSDGFCIGECLEEDNFFSMKAFTSEHIVGYLIIKNNVKLSPVKIN